MRRRRLIVTAAGLVAVAVAGCTDGETVATESPGDAADGDGASGQTDASATSTADSDGSSADGELDLREANVTDVAVEAGDGDEYRVSVTLLHDDDGEDGYANWWQVETLDGDRLGRRDLAHAHGTREFTRSATVAIPSGTDCVVVRGHDQRHGYGGQAALVDVESGAMSLVRQGADPDTFGVTECP